MLKLTKTLNNLITSIQSNYNLSKYLEKMQYYGLPGTKIFRKTKKEDSRYNWKKRNLIGEIYEALVYEALLDWAIIEDEVELFILKGPYTQRFHRMNGFGYDHRQIVLFGDGDRIAEFDVLLKLNDNWVFIEICISNNVKKIRELKLDIPKKRKILTSVLNTEI